MCIKKNVFNCCWVSWLYRFLGVMSNYGGFAFFCSYTLRNICPIVLTISHNVDNEDRINKSPHWCEAYNLESGNKRFHK